MVGQLSTVLRALGQLFILLPVVDRVSTLLEMIGQESASLSVVGQLLLLLLLLLLSTPLHQRAASRVQHPKSCGSQQSLPPGGKERLHFVGIRPEVQARKGGW